MKMHNIANEWNLIYKGENNSLCFDRGQDGDKVAQMAYLSLEILLYIKAFKSIGFCRLITTPKLMGLKIKDLLFLIILKICWVIPLLVFPELSWGWNQLEDQQGEKVQDGLTEASGC